MELYEASVVSVEVLKGFIEGLANIDFVLVVHGYDELVEVNFA